MADKYCMKCGEEIGEGNSVCPFCGEPVEQEEPETKVSEPEVEAEPQVVETPNPSTQNPTTAEEPKKGFGSCLVSLIVIVVVGWITLSLIGHAWDFVAGMINPNHNAEQFDSDNAEAYSNSVYNYPRGLASALLPATYLDKCKLYSGSEDILDTTKPSYSYIIGEIMTKDYCYNSKSEYCYTVSSVAANGPVLRLYTKVKSSNLDIGDCIVVWGDANALFKFSYMKTGNSFKNFKDLQYKEFKLETYGYALTDY